jgi:hypothetical protein
VRHPCFDFTTEGGKRIFNTNESKHPTRRGAPEHVAYFVNPSNRDSSSSDVANMFDAMVRFVTIAILVREYPQDIMIYLTKEFSK